MRALILAVLGLLCGSCATALAREINAASLSPKDIQRAVDSAREGDTVVLPAGSYSEFHTRVNVPNGISMRGQGRENTILQRTSGRRQMLRFNHNNQPSSHRVSISGFKVQGLGDETTDDDGIVLAGGMQDFIVHDMEFAGCGDAGLTVKGNARGVIYDCRFIDNYKHGLGYGVVVYGDSQWDPSPRYGTQDAVFVEDCYFSGQRHSIASNDGSHYVFRYNTVKTNRRGSQVDAHGKHSWPRGSRTYEIYGNLFEGGDTRGRYDLNISIGLRGGDGHIYDNRIIKSTARPITLTNDSGHDGPYPEEHQIRDLYIWGNTLNGRPMTPSDVYVGTKWADDPIILKKGRDYHLRKRPDFAPYPYPHPLRPRGPKDQAKRAVSRRKKTPTQTPVPAAETQKRSREKLEKLSEQAAEAFLSWIQEAVAAGRRETVYVTIMGKAVRTRIAEANETGITVSYLNRPCSLRWADISDRQLFRMARKYASKPGEAPAPERAELIEAFARVHGFETQ